MKHIFALLAVLLLAPWSARCAGADTKTLRVFIFAGQSNIPAVLKKLTAECSKTANRTQDKNEP